MIDENYSRVCSTRSDINEHLPTLYRYSKKCDSIVECGVRETVSTWAFLKGLKDGETKYKRGPSGEKAEKSLTCVDLYKSPNIPRIEQIAKQYSINFQFLTGSDLTVDVPASDLLFIDTWHIYGHLKRELEKLSPKVKKYILLHDTEVDKIAGETIRNGWDARKQSLESGIPEEEIRKGLGEAVCEFVEREGNENRWVVKEHFVNNNGLTVLKRVNW